MVYTGFRISDATLFNMKRLKGDQIFIRATKNGGDVFAYIPDWLRDRLQARAERFGKRPFITGRSERLETVTNISRAFLRSRPCQVCTTSMEKNASALVDRLAAMQADRITTLETTA